MSNDKWSEWESFDVAWDVENNGAATKFLSAEVSEVSPSDVFCLHIQAGTTGSQVAVERYVRNESGDFYWNAALDGPELAPVFYKPVSSSPWDYVKNARHD